MTDLLSSAFDTRVGVDVGVDVVGVDIGAECAIGAALSAFRGARLR